MPQEPAAAAQALPFMPENETVPTDISATNPVMTASKPVFAELEAFPANPTNTAQMIISTYSLEPEKRAEIALYNCTGLLLDKKGTLLLNEDCVEALDAAKSKISFTLKLPHLTQVDIRVQNYKKEECIYKVNYALCQVYLPVSVAHFVPNVQEPVLIQKKPDPENQVEQTPLDIPVSQLFDKNFSTNDKEQILAELPELFYVNLEGFEKPIEQTPATAQQTSLPTPPEVGPSAPLAQQPVPPLENEVSVAAAALP